MTTSPPTPSTPPSRRVPFVSRRVLGVACGLALATAAGLAVHAHASKSSTRKPSVSPVAVMAVQVVHPDQRLVAQSLQASGAVVAQVNASCGPDVPGQRVTSVLVDVGDRVHKGQALAELDSRSLRIALNQATASVRQAQAAWATAQDAYARDEKLRSSGAVSPQALRAAKDQVAQDLATLQASQAQQASAALQLAHSVIRAPVDGVIASRNVSVGQVSSSGAQFFTVVSVPHLQWQPQLTSQQLARVRVGQAASIQLSAGAGKELSGKVVRVSPAVDATTQTALAYVDFDSSKVQPGELLSGSLQEASTQEWTLPASALATQDGVSFVYLVGPKNHVHRKDVQAGASAGSRVVVQGLQPADNVVLSGAALLHEGDLVRVVSGAAQ